MPAPKVVLPGKTDLTQAKSSTHRIPSLDGLRGFSIWAVLLAHASNHFKSSPLHAKLVRSLLANLSYFGVTVFFVISGFLITMLLLQERDRSGTLSLKSFYRRRAVRILPASFVYIGIIVALGHPSIAQRLYALTFTSSYFFDAAYKPLQQLWSLSVEEQFYLLWPLILLWGVRAARRSCWMVLALCPLLRLTLKFLGYHQYSHLAPAILDSIAMGCLLAFYQERVRSFAVRYLLSGWAFASLILCTVLFAEGVYRLELVLLWGGVAGLIALVISAAIERQDVVLNKGPLVWSGLLSYSLYLWQQPFLTLDRPWNYLSLRLVLTFVVAWASYRFVEQPVLRFFSRTVRVAQPLPVLTRS